jgi:DNA polymerase-4
VTGTRRLWGPAKDAAARLRKEAMDGLRLSGAVGVAGNKLVSGIASRIYASPGVFDVDPGREASFLGPLGVDVLPGIGPVRKRMLLEELNITRIRQIAAMDAGSLKLLFGVQARVIHQRARGIDPTPVYPPRRKPLIREEVILPRDENDDQKLLGTLYTLVERCSRRLRDRGLVPRRAGILIRYADQEESGRALRLDVGSAWTFHLYPPLEETFLKACARRVRVRFIRIWFQNFVSGAVQLGLFSSSSPAAETLRATAQAMDRIRDRYGDQAIRFGRVT